jgi:hypothetical protein
MGKKSKSEMVLSGSNKGSPLLQVSLLNNPSNLNPHVVKTVKVEWRCTNKLLSKESRKARFNFIPY